MIDIDEDGVINFKEFSVTLGVICRGELNDRLNFMYRLHLPPALPLSDYDGDNSLEEDGVDSCSEIDESEKIEESDKDTSFAESETDMDPLGAGVVVIHGTLTQSKSNESNTKNNSEDATNISDDVTKDSDDFTNRSDVATNPSQNSSGFSDGCFIENENVDFDLVDKSEMVHTKSMGDGDGDGDEGITEDRRWKQGTYHALQEDSESTKGREKENLEDIVQNNDGSMNQVRLLTPLTSQRQP